MSASSKKKLRKEQDAAKLTEKQLTEQKEAKKVSLYTASFVVVMVLLLAVAIFVGVRQTIVNSGIREKNTVAFTVGSHELNNAEMGYFFMDSVNQFYSTYGSYASLLGLDVTKPLDEQISNEETGATWADDFLESAQSAAHSAYALADAANAAGFVLPEEDQADIDSAISNLDLYASLYGYSNGEDYLKAVYGKGSTVESYRSYCELNALAQAYQEFYSDSLTYTDEDLRTAEAENYNAYSSFTFHTYYLAASRFLTGGTTDEDGNTTYSEEETAASIAAAEEAAKQLTGEEIDSVEALDEAIAALSINADTEASSTAYDSVLYSSISSLYADWLAEDGRVSGDKAYFENTSTSTDENGESVSTVSGYYVVYFESSTDNTFPLSNVRHILVSFEGGTTDETTGVTTYSDEEKAAAKTSAEEILAEWEAGDATEESFAQLANEKSDDGDGTTGGLYENISPDSSYVTNFKEWALADHEPGDTGIVETEYGYHVMYYVGDTNYTYRDYQIETQLRSEDVSTWYTETVDAVSTTVGDTSYIRKDLVLSSAG